MQPSNLKEKLYELLALPHENEVVEFKTAGSEFSVEKLGQYFSALSNEANLKNFESGWLVLGISNDHKIVGTRFSDHPKKLNELKRQISSKTNGQIGFTNLHELIEEGRRILLFEIPAAPVGTPTSFSGHYYGREGESLVALSDEKIRRIHKQILPDWSAAIVSEAIIDGLDANAIKKAREEYIKKHPYKQKEIEKWNDHTFLNKSKLTINGKITRTALLLLGNETSAHLLTPFVAQISWVLYDAQGKKLDYQHFYPPFILTNDQLLSKIRNLNYRHMIDNTLFPLEVTQYDIKVIREALHNCIAHQDYALRSRILVLEYPNYLVFENAGNFLPETVERVIKENSPQRVYRNKFLCDAMVNLNMIETIGDGIRTMFTLQRNRYFPLPDYDLSDPKAVKVKVYGTILNENYTQALLHRSNLDLLTVMMLDNVQKGKKIPENEAKKLKLLRLIEGRRPNYYVSEKVADLTKEKATYIKNKGLDDAYYKDLILGLLKKFKTAKRSDIDELLMSKLPAILNPTQKKSKITNLIYALSAKEGKIKNIGKSRKWSTWVLKN